MIKSYIIAYPWDLIDEGLDSVLDRLVGEIGVSGVSLWVSTPPLIQLRMRPVEPRVFRTTGGLMYQTSARRSSSSLISPLVSEWAGRNDVMHEIAAACATRSLELRVRMSAAGTGLVARQHPETACRNLYGDQSDSFICLGNPDVQEYLCGVAANLSTEFSPAGLVLSDFVIAWAEGLALESPRLKRSNSLPESLLSLCFCDSCRGKAQRSGVDANAALRRAKELLRETLDAEPDDRPTIDSVLAENEVLAKYYSWRGAELGRVCGQLSGAFDGELLVDGEQDYLSNGLWFGFDFGLPSGVLVHCQRGIDGSNWVAWASSSLPVLFSGQSRANKFAHATRPPHRAAHQSIPDRTVVRAEHPGRGETVTVDRARRRELRIPASIDMGGGSQLVGSLPDLVEHGISGVEFEHYGEFTDTALTSLKQAIRFARRVTSV